MVNKCTIKILSRSHLKFYIGYHGGNSEFDEFLLYDFDLAIGDTFNLTPYNFKVLQSIDSILIEGAYYRKFNFESNYYWIEGIGSSIGFFPYFDFFEKQLHFNCFYDDPCPSFSKSDFYAVQTKHTVKKNRFPASPVFNKTLF